MEQPAKHLSVESKKFWRRIASEYELTQDAALLLRSALENWDRAQSARVLIAKEGMVLGGENSCGECGRTGSRRHPAIDIEKQCYGLFQRFMRQLGLDIVPPGPTGRPSTSV